MNTKHDIANFINSLFHKLEINYELDSTNINKENFFGASINLEAREFLYIITAIEDKYNLKFIEKDLIDDRLFEVEGLILLTEQSLNPR